uniref:DUF4219 domain-containing protein n=1 Tax=Lactuca sativa TaxID=4236 RepID=A0A9R1V398_LACSA|nr:hypothetical protein LSAT_V11C700376860 [Lactuca sativa]
MSLVKEGGGMTYQVPFLTPTNYLMWAVKVNSIMDEYDIWETVELKALGEASDQMKSKQALAFLHGVANGELHRPKVSVTWVENTVFGSESGDTGSTCNLKKGA